MRPVLVNSVPKCGTHLLLNILRMFTPVEQVHRTFVGDWNIGEQAQNLAAGPSKLFAGHVNLNTETLLAVRPCRHFVVVRDPYDYAIAQARFFMAEDMGSDLGAFTRAHDLSFAETLSLVIFGARGPAYWPSLHEIFTTNAVAWLANDVFLVRYEDLLARVEDLEAPASEIYLTELLTAAGLGALPSDWKRRVLAGAQRRHSATDRSNLRFTRPTRFPARLSQEQAALVDYASPGLRRLLGYA